jgi:hypothetical protein
MTLLSLPPQIHNYNFCIVKSRELKVQFKGVVASNNIIFVSCFIIFRPFLQKILGAPKHTHILYRYIDIYTHLVMLTTHPHLVPRLRMSRSYTSSPPHVPPWRVAGQLTLPYTQLGPETSYPDRGIVAFVSPSRQIPP